MSDMPNDTNARGAIKLAQNFADKSFSGYATLAIAEAVLYLADVLRHSSQHDKDQEKVETSPATEGDRPSTERPWYEFKRPYASVERSEQEWKRAFILLSVRDFALKEFVTEIMGKCISVDDVLAKEIVAIGKKALAESERISAQDKEKVQEELQRVNEIEAENTRLKKELEDWKADADRLYSHLVWDSTSRLASVQEDVLNGIRAHEALKGNK